MLWPSASALLAISGWAATFLPRRKNVARTHSFLRASRTFGVVLGQGPSSNVRTNSLARSGSVEGNCLRPTRGVLLASTAIIRAVPSASGLPGHEAAVAVTGAKATAIKRKSARVIGHPMPQRLATGKLRFNRGFVRESLPEVQGRAYKRRAFILPAGFDML